jgi:hypothetical protein
VVLRVPSGRADRMLVELDKHAAYLEQFGGDHE